MWVLVQLRRHHAPERLRSAATALVTVLVLQAAVGYTQYFTGVPALLVALHVLGASLVWLAVLNLGAADATAPGDRCRARGRLIGWQRHRPSPPRRPRHRTLMPSSTWTRPGVVLVWNDPINTIDYVALVFQKLFGYSKTKAMRLTMDVHTKGRAVVSNGPRREGRDRRVPAPRARLVGHHATRRLIGLPCPGSPRDPAPVVRPRSMAASTWCSPRPTGRP